MLLSSAALVLAAAMVVVGQGSDRMPDDLHNLQVPSTVTFEEARQCDVVKWITGAGGE